MIKKIFTHSFLYAIGPQIPRIASIFILPLTTAYLTAEDYGTSALLMAYTGAIAAFKDLGVLVLLMNYFFQRPQKWQILWRRLYGYLILWSPFYLILVALVIYAALPSSALHYYPSILFIYAFTNLIFDIPILFGSRYFQFSQKPLPIAINTAFVGIIAVFLNLYTIVYLKMGFMGWIVSTFLASFISFLYYGYFVFITLKLFPIFKINIKHISSILKISLPTIPHNYSSYLLNTSDRAMLSFFNVPISTIGKYNLAYSFGSYFEVFSTAVGMAVGPFYAKIFSSNHSLKHQIAMHFTYLLQYAFLGLGFIVAIWLKEVFQILINNNELRYSYYISVIIIMAYTNKPFYWSSINLLIYQKSTTDLWKITFAGGIISIILNIVLIPFLSVWGAVISSFISLTYIGFYGGFIDKVKKLGRLNHREIYWISISCILTLIAYLIVDINFSYKIIITLLALFITGLKIMGELKTIKKFDYKF